MSRNPFRLLMFFPIFAVLLLSTFLLTAKTSSLPANAEGINIGNGSWSWQHPQPQGNALLGIDCPTQSDCYAGGYLGYYDSSSNNRAFVIQSKDGNETWSGQELTGHGINRLHCISANTCYAASFFGHVLKTTNAGQTWVTQTTNTDKNLQGIYCFSASNCIAVGDGGTIREMTNGGQTWLSRTSNTYLALKDVTCINSSLCLIVGGSGMYGTGDGIVLRSQNGGDSWQTITTQVGNILNAIACFDATTCVTVGWGGVIHVSENAGSSWRSATAHTTSILTDIECPTTEKCFITSDDGQIYTSSDGYIWLELDIQNDISLKGISCPSTQKCTAVGDNGHLLTTTNGGIDWQRNTEGIITSTTLWICYNNGSCGTEYINRINDLECFTDGRCLAVSHTGLLFLGDTLNSSWSTSKVNTTQNLLGLSCVEGQTTNTCYAAGSGGTVWKSVNNGVSWQTTTTGSTSRFFDTDCATSSTCVAVGEDGAVIWTTNGGTSWQKPTSVTILDLWSVQCTSATHCIAVGERGEVIYTNNGGQSWQKPVGAPIVSNYGDLAGIFCQTTSDCLAVGNDWPPNKAILYRTFDGGVNWNEGTLDFPFGLIDITCTPTGLCTAVGSMGSILRSEDWGYTWQEESSGTTWPLFSVSCLDDGSCFAGGEQGIILGAAMWPEISVEHSFSGVSFADNAPISSKIAVTNHGGALAQQIQITNTLPLALQPSGPVTVSWGSETVTINSPTWPNLLSGLNITLTTGSTLLVEFPLIVDNPQQLIQQVESHVAVQANGLPRALETDASVILAQSSLLLPVISAPSPDTCYGPYLDNFASSSSGWPSGDTGNTVYGYLSGEYSIVHKQANQWFAVTRGDLWQSDLLLELDGYQLVNNGLWGLLFGLNGNWSDFYTFEILPNYQEWYIFNFNAATGWSEIASGSANYILSGQGKNSLLIQGANNKMYFYINNYLVYELDEKPGYTGLTGGSFSNNTQLRYDNYTFHQRDCSIVGFQLERGEQFPKMLVQEHQLLMQTNN